MDKETLDAIKEMKFLYEGGADLEFLSCLYPMTRERIKEFCEQIDKQPNLKEFLTHDIMKVKK